MKEVWRCQLLAGGDGKPSSDSPHASHSPPRLIIPAPRIHLGVSRVIITGEPRNRSHACLLAAPHGESITLNEPIACNR